MIARLFQIARLRDEARSAVRRALAPQVPHVVHGTPQADLFAAIDRDIAELRRLTAELRALADSPLHQPSPMTRPEARVLP